MPSLRMIRPAGALLAGGLALAVPAGSGPARADGWSVNGQASQSLAFDTNPDLDPDRQNTVFGTTTLTLDLQKSTPRTTISLAPSVSGTVSDGAAGADDLTGVRPSVRAAWRHNLGETQLSARANARVTPTEFSALANPEFAGFDEEGEPVVDLDIIDQDALQLTVGLNAGINHRLDPANRLGLSISSSLVRFDRDDDALTPSTSVGMRGTFGHRINTATGTSLALGLRRVSFDRQAGDETDYVLDLDGSFDHRVNRALTFGMGTGLNLSSSEDEGLTPGLNLSGNLAYIATPRDRLSLRLSQVTDPGSDGNLQTRTTAGFGYSHSIGALDAIDLQLRYSRQEDIGGAQDARQLFNASVSYSIALTETIRGSLGYRMRDRIDGDGRPISHNFFFSLSKDLSFLP